jgi:hypothetical protein
MTCEKISEGKKEYLHYRVPFFLVPYRCGVLALKSKPWIQTVPIQPKMLDPDPESMNQDPKH